ncbi:MAG: FkbM family methyltransferase [Leptolyngbyaceae cyanobacterium MO_188.B28]|nr:FkbM family methyltransferase [Leptolyngbyaceae cyanobacterium MO_188.B28]
MRQIIKRILGKVSRVRRIPEKLKLWRYKIAVKRLFVNPELYFRALVEKDNGAIVLKTRDGLSITIRQNIWDARIIKEIFIDKPYIRYFKLPKNPVIVDVGGYIGDFSIYAAKYLNSKTVIVYEPTAENFEILKQNIENNGLEDRITAVKKAVSNSNDVMLNVDIQESDEVHVSAYWYPNAEKRLVPSVTVSDILSEHQLDSIDLLKVDCEGGEYDIFPGLTDETLRCIRNIVFEYHRVDGFEEKLDHVMERLKSTGYQLRLEGNICYASRS